MIEGDPQRLEWIDERYPEVLTVIGDATLDVNLRESGILKARGLLSCLSADSDNVFVCLSARDLNPDLTIVARALEEGSMEKLYRAGADHVVSPNVHGAIRMASMLLRPEVGTPIRWLGYGSSPKPEFPRRPICSGRLRGLY